MKKKRTRWKLERMDEYSEILESTYAFGTVALHVLAECVIHCIHCKLVH